jgi:uncharacterized protein YyaL (SSP411 family)
MIQRHLDYAVRWVLTARKHSADGGIPARYDLLRNRWSRSYPETTGYTIPTLFSCAARLDEPQLRQVGIALADYLLDVRTPEGGVAHWQRTVNQPAIPIVFDTGQVIFGWIAAWRETHDARYLSAAVQAGDWLVRIQDPSGAWLAHQHLGKVKVIDTRVAWALLELARVVRRNGYIHAARRNLNWALEQQLPDGWFRLAAFTSGADPFTHALAYTAEGLLESGLLLNDQRFVVAAERVAAELLERQRPDGALASTYGPGWRPTHRSSCLTGNCQMAILWLRLSHLTRNSSYVAAARKAVAFVAATQNLHTRHAGVRGAIAGSFPITGRYERFKYPNWAAKFFIDALLALPGEDSRAAVGCTGPC